VEQVKGLLNINGARGFGDKILLGFGIKNYRQRIEILINEEALLLAKYLRDEKKTWILRLTS